MDFLSRRKIYPPERNKAAVPASQVAKYIFYRLWPEIGKSFEISELVARRHPLPVSFPPMAEFKHLPGFGAAVMVLRNLCGLTQADAGKLMGVGHQQVGKYEKGKVSPTVEALGGLLQDVGIPFTEFANLTEAIGQVVTRLESGDLQYPLWREIELEIREPGTIEGVTSVLCFTDRGKLLAIDDPDINEDLTRALDRPGLHKEVLLTFKPPRRSPPPKPRPGGPAKGGRKE